MKSYKLIFRRKGYGKEKFKATVLGLSKTNAKDNLYAMNRSGSQPIIRSSIK